LRRGHDVNIQQSLFINQQSPAFSAEFVLDNKLTRWAINLIRQLCFRLFPILGEAPPEVVVPVAL
jgi:hypothetical protein